MRDIEKAIIADLSVDKAYEHMTFLVEEVGERLAGTKEIAKAANYIRDELEKCGLEARVDHFPIYHSYPGSAALKVTFPEERTIEALPSCHIPSTLDEGMKGELVYAGAGGYRDYERIDAKDRIILVDSRNSGSGLGRCRTRLGDSHGDGSGSDRVRSLFRRQDVSSF